MGKWKGPPKNQCIYVVLMHVQRGNRASDLQERMDGANCMAAALRALRCRIAIYSMVTTRTKRSQTGAASLR